MASWEQSYHPAGMASEPETVIGAGFCHMATRGRETRHEQGAGGSAAGSSATAWRHVASRFLLLAR